MTPLRSHALGASRPVRRRPLGASARTVVVAGLVVLVSAALVAGRGPVPADGTGSRARVVAGAADRVVVATIQPTRIELRTAVSVLAVGVAVALALFAVGAVLAPARRAPRPRPIPVRGRAPPTHPAPHVASAP